MEETQNWRQMFERSGRPRLGERADGNGRPAGNSPSPLGGYDDGFQPQAPTPAGQNGDAIAGGPAPLSPAEIIEEAALALALDTSEYRPWLLQRARTQPVLMLHLRRHDPKSGLWMGWELSYPHLVAVEYTGDKLLSLDFGSRQFMLEGAGLDELARHLQTGNVLMIQEYAARVWPGQLGGPRVSTIHKLNVNNDR